MFIFNIPLVCYVSSTALELYLNENLQKFLFPPEVIQYYEIVDKEKFQKTLLDFLDQINFKKGKGVIVLSSELVFTSEITTSDKSVEDPINHFFSSVPLTRDTIARLTIEDKDKTRVYATNKSLYEIVLTTFNQKGIVIDSVVPINAFETVSENQELSIDDIRKKINNTKITRKYNFLQTKQQEAINSPDKGEKSAAHTNITKQYIMLIFSFLLLAGALLYLLLRFNPWFKKDTHVVPKSTFLPTHTPSPTTQLNPTLKSLDKYAIKIQILNGSGIEGQAGKLNLLLENYGYKDITTGNAKALEKKTTILYSKQISSTILKDVQNVLKNDFTDVIVEKATQSAEFDIIITTGSDK